MNIFQCTNPLANRCPKQLCAWCCDRDWHRLQAHSDDCGDCAQHQPDGLPRTWALFSHDEYLVQVHDMGAWLDRLINHTLEKHVDLQHVAPPSMAQLKAVIWMDGGKSAGRKMSKVCLCIGCLCEPCGPVVVASHLVEMV